MSRVSLFYSVVSSSVNVNGFVFRPFTLSRWVWRGSPLSPLLYVSWPKCWLVISVPILISLAWLYLGLFSTLHVLLRAHADDSSIIVSPSFYVCALSSLCSLVGCSWWRCFSGAVSSGSTRLVLSFIFLLFWFFLVWVFCKGF